MLRVAVLDHELPQQPLVDLRERNPVLWRQAPQTFFVVSGMGIYTGSLPGWLSFFLAAGDTVNAGAGSAWGSGASNIARRFGFDLLTPPPPV